MFRIAHRRGALVATVSAARRHYPERPGGPAGDEANPYGYYDATAHASSSGTFEYAAPQSGYAQPPPHHGQPQYAHYPPPPEAAPSTAASKLAARFAAPGLTVRQQRLRMATAALCCTAPLVAVAVLLGLDAAPVLEVLWVLLAVAVLVATATA